MKVLFLGSNPAETSRLRLDREYREIDRHLRENAAGQQVELISAWAVRVEDLSGELLRHRPDVVHFSGHGSPGGLIFDTDGANGYTAPIGPLANLFGLVSRGRTLTGVVLNACYSKAQADAIAKHVPVVVGTTSAINDTSAITFASGLYRGLAFGMSMTEAIELGRNAVELASLPGAEILVTSTKGTPS